MIYLPHVEYDTIFIKADTIAIGLMVYLFSLNSNDIYNTHDSYEPVIQ